jgi:hypothetical protein
MSKQNSILFLNFVSNEMRLGKSDSQKVFTSGRDQLPKSNPLRAERDCSEFINLIKVV